MELKAYQTRTLETLRFYLEQLAEMKIKAAKARELDLEIDFAVDAWKKTAPTRAYFPRRNALGEPLPSVCFKIATGGGKTLLATHAVDLVNLHYRQKQTGLVLWIVPTTQIYNQTLAAFRDRDHPYRQILDAASAGRPLILEKQSGFSPADVQENLCVLMLMLPSANRQSKEQLRMFRDSGGFDQFFPSDDDQRGHADLLAKIPTLHTFEKESGFWGRQIKTSLGNTLQLLNPLIILDEGHKAYSENARKTLEEFNPCLILELSATPAKTANVLVEILGKELLAEEMIKLDLHIQNRASAAWKDTMLAAIEHRDWLEEEARTYQSNTDVHIRPICLIQVERTGKDQRKPGVIHADDVKDYLIKTRGLPEEQIAIKTSQLDELKEVDEVGGLLSRDCPIRYIITKQALQEGWDCSFAYVLTILTNPGSKNALTQLVGRILRQPYARKRVCRRWMKVTCSAFNNAAPSC
jgi:type III restriction enzyme